MSSNETFKTPQIPQRFGCVLQTPKTPELSSELAALLLKKGQSGPSDPLKVKLFTFDNTELLKPLDDCVDNGTPTFETAPTQPDFNLLPSSSSRNSELQQNKENLSVKRNLESRPNLEFSGTPREAFKIPHGSDPVTQKSLSRDVERLSKLSSQEYPEVFPEAEVQGSARKPDAAYNSFSNSKPALASNSFVLHNKLQKQSEEQRLEEVRARIRKILLRQQSEPSFSSEDEDEKGNENPPKSEPHSQVSVGSTTKETTSQSGSHIKTEPHSHIPVILTTKETVSQSGNNIRRVPDVPRIIPPPAVTKRTPLTTLWQPRLGINREDKISTATPSQKPKEEVPRYAPILATNPDKPKETSLVVQTNTPSAPDKSQSILGCRQLTVNGRTYHVIGDLGKGGSSKVYQALDEESKALRAIKVVDLSQVDRDCSMAYRKEVNFLIKLQDCERVIHMFDYEYKEAEQMLYIVMEKGDGDLVHILRELASGKESCSEWQIKSYWSQMLKAVDEIHKKGIIHSDLKPANFIMVNGKLKLIDFGIASALHSDMTSVVKDTQVGTINYMSPESILHSTSQAGGIKVRPKSDVWSLGCILYNLTYGHTPFQSIRNPFGKMQAISNCNYQIPFPPCKDVFLIDVLKKCLERDPTKRPSIEELLSHPYLTLPSGNVQSLVESLRMACSPNTLSQVSKALEPARLLPKSD